MSTQEIRDLAKKVSEGDLEATSKLFRVLQRSGYGVTRDFEATLFTESPQMELTLEKIKNGGFWAHCSYTGELKTTFLFDLAYSLAMNQKDSVFLYHSFEEGERLKESVQKLQNPQKTYGNIYFEEQHSNLEDQLEELYVKNPFTMVLIDSPESLEGILINHNSLRSVVGRLLSLSRYFGDGKIPIVSTFTIPRQSKIRAERRGGKAPPFYAGEDIQPVILANCDLLTTSIFNKTNQFLIQNLKSNLQNPFESFKVGIDENGFIKCL